MKNLDTIAEQLFNEIRGRFPSIELGDAEGNITNEPALARFYDFDFQSNGKKLGKVSVSLDENDGVVVMYSKDFVESEFGSIKTDWYGFLKNLRTFTKKRLLNFEVRDINRSNLTKRDYKFLASNRSGEQTMAESKMYGNAKTSFQKIGGAKLSIKHTGAIEEGGSRTSKIGAIFIENTDGERFKYPYKHLSGARALALHISEGGHPYDDFGKYITGLSEELSNLRKFKTYMGRSSVMAESLAEHMGTVNERMVAVKKEIQNLQKPSYYAEAFEQYVPIEESEVPAEVAENWIDQLTVKQFNEELKDVFPYIYNLVSENTKTQELQFEDIITEQDMVYSVKRGDTVYAIAKAYGISVEDIIEVNGLDDNASIRAGDQLTLPGVDDGTEIGSTPGNPATRGIPPEQNYSPEDYKRLINQSFYSEAIDKAIDSLMGQFAEGKEMCPEACCGMPVTECTCGPDCKHCDCYEKNKMNEQVIDEAHMKGYSKYRCKDCGCQMHNCDPDCDCEHDSHDESGDWWVDKDGNGVPDKFEGKDHDYDGDGDEDGDDYMKAKDIAIKKAIAKAAEKKESKIPLGEFILSYFDRETGQFPKGPTAVLTMVEKEYGEQYVRPAAKFIERIDAKVAEVMGYAEAETELEVNPELDRISSLAGLR
jgi:LysM repeat protein